MIPPSHVIFCRYLAFVLAGRSISTAQQKSPDNSRQQCALTASPKPVQGTAAACIHIDAPWRRQDQLCNFLIRLLNPYSPPAAPGCWLPLGIQILAEIYCALHIVTSTPGSISTCYRHVCLSAIRKQTTDAIYAEGCCRRSSDRRSVIAARRADGAATQLNYSHLRRTSLLLRKSLACTTSNISTCLSRHCLPILKIIEGAVVHISVYPILP